ncbi:MAG TPA: sulfite exporter TauE/SafE family protein [Balneolaceae bacterium]|nr:sulfite exporter TauE/SafE family protein [Balneolaceae bacterium]
MKSNIKSLLYIFVGPVVLVYICWFFYMIYTEGWGLFVHNFYMSLTMILGSMVAGASSEGGGAVAYPVMTLVFNIKPAVARNFSLAIQSIGMTAASLWIIARGIKIETTYLLYAMIGGTAGIIVSTFTIAPHVAPGYAKMMFVSFWLSFGIALFFINHINKRDTYDSLDNLNNGQKIELLIIGFIGGTLSAIFGNGIDICTFAFVTLKYHLSEKVATPTSVVLMTSNAIVGTFLHFFILGDMQTQAINFWLVCIPICVIGAPMGAFIISKVNRISIAYLLYTLITVQFIAALFIISPHGMLLAASFITFVVGMVIFFVLTRIGKSGAEAKTASSTSSSQ